MEEEKIWSWKSSSLRIKNTEEEEEIKNKIPPPRTPQEPMEFLSRSWSVSASEISKALAEKMKFCHVSNVVPQTIVPSQLICAAVNSTNAHRSTVRRWFHNKDFSSTKSKKKEKARIDNARVHAAVSVAGVAAAVAALAAAANVNHPNSKMSSAMASATELLASHCMEIAESSGANHDQVASVVRSAMDVKTPGDLMTLTAAAATALRGAAALKSRVNKEPRNSAAIIPYEKGVGAACHLVQESRMEADSRRFDIPRKEGKLLKRTKKGILHWKRVSIYVNKKSQVIVKLKSKHVGGAFSKKKKSVVYDVCEDIPAWPGRESGENGEEKSYFGLKTAQGLLEFECKDKLHRQKWVDCVRSLIQEVNGIDCSEASEPLLKFD